jgi:hypothetical protein
MVNGTNLWAVLVFLICCFLGCKAQAAVRKRHGNEYHIKMETMELGMLYWLRFYGVIPPGQVRMIFMAMIPGATDHGSVSGLLGTC